MALDFSRMKKFQTDLQSKGEKKDFTKIYFKPALGKQFVRIVPWKEDKSFPFITVQLHKYDTFKKYIPTLNNFGETDPILAFRKKVYDDVTSTKEDKEFMKTLSPKTSTFVQVIVRGQEDLGVRLWELNNTNLEAVAAILGEEEEYGDVTDVLDGRDLLVEGHSEVNPKTGKSYIAVTIKPRVKKSPLSEDADDVKKWQKEQHNPLEQYKRYSAEELTTLLENYLNPADGSDDGEDETPAPKPAPKAPVKAPEAKPKFRKPDPVEGEEEAPAPKSKAKLVEEDPEDETPAPKPKPKAKPAPVAEEDEDLSPGDELEEALPKTKPAAKPAAKPKPAAEKPKPLSVASKFAALYDDDEDDA